MQTEVSKHNTNQMLNFHNGNHARNGLWETLQWYACNNWTPKLQNNEDNGTKTKTGRAQRSNRIICVLSHPWHPCSQPSLYQQMRGHHNTSAAGTCNQVWGFYKALSTRPGGECKYKKYNNKPTITVDGDEVVVDGWIVGWAMGKF